MHAMMDECDATAMIFQVIRGLAETLRETLRRYFAQLLISDRE